MRSKAISKVFLRMSKLGALRARRTSIRTSCMTSRWRSLSSYRTWYTTTHGLGDHPCQVPFLQEQYEQRLEAGGNPKENSVLTCSLSSTISRTLLSLCETSSWQKQFAAARTAVGAFDNETSVTAHSYTTAVDRLCSNAKMILIYFPFCSGLVRQTYRQAMLTWILNSFFWQSAYI